MIKWERLKKLAKEISGMDVEIYASTDVADEIISMVGIKENGRVDILLNMNRVKSADMAKQAIAHEITHAMMMANTHGPEFKEQLIVVENEVRRRYEA